MMNERVITTTSTPAASAAFSNWIVDGVLKYNVENL
jgi:hypothetical protein